MQQLFINFCVFFMTLAVAVASREHFLSSARQKNKFKSTIFAINLTINNSNNVRLSLNLTLSLPQPLPLILSISLSVALSSSLSSCWRYYFVARILTPIALGTSPSFDFSFGWLAFLSVSLSAIIRRTKSANILSDTQICKYVACACIHA